jgi:membrane protein
VQSPWAFWRCSGKLEGLTTHEAMAFLGHRPDGWIMTFSRRSQLALAAGALLPAWRRLSNHRAGLLAAGVAFYSLLSLFPGIAALVALAGLWMTPEDIRAAADSVRSLMPEDAAQLLLSQLDQIASAPNGGLGFAVVAGFAVALYSASKAVGSLVDAVSAVRGAVPDRGLLAMLLTHLVLTLLMICIAALMMASILVVPVFIGLVLPTSQAAPWIALLRWPIVAGFIFVGIAAIYRSADGSPLQSKQPFLSPGAMAAALVILPASIGFSIYIEGFTDYTASFGALGGAVTLLIWLWLSAYIVIGGAGLDAELASATASAVDGRNGRALPTS